MEIPKNKNIRLPKYLKFIRSKPCIVCLKRGPNQAHHEDQTFYNKGTGLKPPDTQTVPMCPRDHHHYGHSQKSDSEIIRYKKLMIEYLCEYINKEYNTDPHVLIVNMLSDWLNKNS